jgi:ketosteroid isomerase-like protein
MTQENVEVVRQVYGAFQEGDSEKVMNLVSPDVELHGTSGGLSDGSVARGIEAVRQTFEMWDEDWETELSPQEFIDAGEQVVVLQQELRRGRGSGVEVEAKTAVLYGLHDGRLIRIQGFMSQDEALSRRAAGVARYCAGDVAGQHRTDARGRRDVECRGLGTVPGAL